MVVGEDIGLVVVQKPEALVLTKASVAQKVIESVAKVVADILKRANERA